MRPSYGRQLARHGRLYTTTAPAERESTKSRSQQHDPSIAPSLPQPRHADEAMDISNS